MCDEVVLVKVTTHKMYLNAFIKQSNMTQLNPFHKSPC